ncbi:MAG: 5-methyltetrahydropteroyltriglutamate--homocysteine S-methyltransferase [Proteobacteria bacterium]|jgi:5-methyltetrahydropteroyltriglutamate--homocysteine methyltransferase|nr:5-methyltetrahydropteroyltriglutamate--homocysteine S-methyltransferase [Alphaproteobacteria bacterium]NCC02858.1 5-methyltetrahydropteroyltriglutamate--homocysteine S-methyltransferase [Pseudomonadota bacterium]
MAQSTLLGYPRLGPHRELKFATERYWRQEGSLSDLLKTGLQMREYNRDTQKQAGIDMFPCNDFSFYDQMLDMSALLGVVPSRYGWAGNKVDLDTYFAMARGAQHSGADVPACEMTKWFDTNYHYIVPEFETGQVFKCCSNKPVDAFQEMRATGAAARPVLVGPMTYLLLGKSRDGSSPLGYLDALLPAYVEVLKKLEEAGAAWVQLDEPCLVTDLDIHQKEAYEKAYAALRAGSKLKFFVTTPFGRLDDNLALAASLPIDALHIDLVAGEGQMNDVLAAVPESMILALGVVDGRNIWRNNMEKSLQKLEYAAKQLGNHRVWVTTSCSLLHVPYDLDAEIKLGAQLKSWMAFAKQKAEEVAALACALNEGRQKIYGALVCSTQATEGRKLSKLIHEPSVGERLREQPLSAAGRATPFAERRKLQVATYKLPLFPTTTIGSFPQTEEVRKNRASWRAQKMTDAAYDAFVRDQIAACVKWQDEIGLDVLVHGEFERNDMVEFFGEKLHGFAFTENGWVQSYGTRGVKPPIIYGDVLRPEPMTVDLARYAQSLSAKPVKGMLTGPVTILQWSFVRDDQPRSVTAHQIALSLQDEVLDLESAGISIIQIDEPAFREGLPLRRKEHQAYFDWAIQAFRMASTGVKDETQIHTHMCYSDFNNIITAIKDLDADVISIETSRSQMELLDAFVTFKYPNEIGPGVYDIHSPRVPPEDEILSLIEKACQRLEPWQIWINPDCGLKTRDWPEVKASLSCMVSAARHLRERYAAKGA